jgi:KUP system potassium uptake protein
MIGFLVLGTAFLTVMGCRNTIYSDMGCFRRGRIRFAGFAVALPALLLNYFEQGALILGDTNAISHPLYGLGPEWAHYRW